MSDTTQAGALRAVADLLEAHPDLPPPYITSGALSGGRHWIDATWQLMLSERDSLPTQKAVARTIVRSIGGVWDKREGGGDFYFETTRDGIKLKVGVEREAVCERIVTGTTTVTIAAQEATPERTEEHEIVEWRCEPLLAEVAR